MISIGDTVRSCAVGIAPEFVGEVIALGPGNTRFFPVRYFHVRDSSGNVWFRDSNELTKLEVAA